MTSTKDIIHILIMFFVIMSVIIAYEVRIQKTSKDTSLEEQAINYWDIFNPDMNYPIYNIDCAKKEIVREHTIKIDKEMNIISKFIKKHNNRVPLLVADQISNSIITRCKADNIPTELIIGIIEVESLYDPYAIGPPVGGNQRRRARGLGQILDAKSGRGKISKDKLHNIDYNIVCTIDIIKDKLKATGGDVEKSLYFYVGKDDKYSAKVFKVMGEFRYFRSQLLSK